MYNDAFRFEFFGSVNIVSGPIIGHHHHFGLSYYTFWFCCIVNSVVDEILPPPINYYVELNENDSVT